MARYNNKKLQTQRNFQSIWHSQPEHIGTLLKEDQLIREYIIGTMRTKGWKLSEIIIKRKVKQIHIAFQIQNKIIKERKRWTKNRLKNRNKALGFMSKRSKGTRGVHASLAVRTRLRKMTIKKRFLFFQLYLMITELRRMYPNNQITFYVQKTKPLQFNATLVNSWIIENIKKKKSYKRLLNRVISKFKKAQPSSRAPSKPIGLLLKNKNDKKNFLSWVTGNLIYLYNVQRLINKNRIRSVNINSVNWISGVTPRSSTLNKTGNMPKKHKRSKATRTHVGFAPIWWRLKKKYGWMLFKSSNSRKKSGWLLNEKQKLTKQLIKARVNLSATLCDKKKYVEAHKELTKVKNLLSGINKRILNKRKDRCNQNKVGDFFPYSAMEKKRNKGVRFLKASSAQKRSMSTMSKMQLVVNPSHFSGLTSTELSQFIWPGLRQISKTRQKWQPGGQHRWPSGPAHTCAGPVLASKTNIDSKISINQDIRSTWKLMRKVSKGRSLNKRRIRGKFNNANPQLKGVLKHRKEFNEDTLLLLNYYKLKYLLALTKSSKSTDLGDSNFLWQGMKFVNFIQQHPALFDHTIKCLISNISSPIEYLTRAWVGFFDYLYHYESKQCLGKYQGIRILLSGRVGFKKMGRAKKYSRYWGSLKNSSARLPLQYSYSQHYTRYGVVGVKLFVR